MPCSQYTPKKFEDATIAGHFEFVFEENSQAGESNDYCDLVVFEKKRFSFHTKTQTRIFKFQRFHDREVWTVGPTVEIKLRFQISPGTGLNFV